MRPATPRPRGLAARCLAMAAGALAPLVIAASEPAPPAPAPADQNTAPIAAITRPARLPGFGPRVFGEHPTVQQMSELGRRLFNDASLSRSGRMACASCHDSAHAHAPANALAVQFGGAAMNRPGTRAVPTLRYLSATVPFTEHLVDDEDGHGEDNGPTGGLTWDGRVDTLHEQARIPLFAGHEFANASAAELARRVRRAPYAAAFDAAFSGPNEPVFDDAERVVAWVAAALEVYQQSPGDFYPYSSKYDAYLRRQTTLNAAEQRGLALFNRPDKGNCASCHPSALGSGGALPRFTDSAYSALGLPRNRQIPANRDPAHYDLGLCDNGRKGLSDHEDYCGRFKTPTLRNVATRRAFFHNGVIHSLEDAVRFYAERDTRPERWYPLDAKGRVRKFDDLPARLHDKVETKAPFGGTPGATPALDAAEVRDIVAFLKTLTDGWVPPQASAGSKRAAP